MPVHDKQRVKEMARERIELLVATALAEGDPDLAGRQAMLAKKIAMRHRVRMPYSIRQLFCKKCKSFIVPGRTSRVRTGGNSVRITCLKCGHTYRKMAAK